MSTTDARDGSGLGLAFGVGAGESNIRRLRDLRDLRAAQAREGGATAFVLSGGGARGALHVGALRALLEAGVRPDMVIGTSIGAWNAAWLARMPTLEGVEKLAAVWQALRPEQVLLGRGSAAGMQLRGLLLLGALGRMVRGRASLYADVGLRQMLQSHFGAQTFADLELPLRIVAANLTQGGRTVFEAGQLVPALLASSAIPGIFPPVRIGHAYYADGGTVDGCSVETAVALGARRIYVLAIGYDTEGDGGARWQGGQAQTEAELRCSAAAAIQRASQVMGNYQIMRALERVPAGVETHVVSLATGDGGGTLRFGASAQWIEHAYATTRTQLAAQAAAQAAAQPGARAADSAHSAIPAASNTSWRSA